MKNSILLLLLLTSTFAFAQKNSVKTGVTDALFGHFNLSYERAVTEKGALTIKFGYWNPTSSPFVTDESFTPEAYNFRKADGGYNVSIEYRFYLSSKSALNGFYVAPYLRYFGQSGIFEDEIEARLFDVNVNLNTFGLGAQIGYQWLINEAFTIDFYFFGAGIDLFDTKIKYTLQQPEPNFNYGTITDDVNEVFEDINYLESKLEHEVNPDNHLSNLPFLFPGFRAGLSLGYSF